MMGHGAAVAVCSHSQSSSLQVSARVRRDSSWQVIPSRELVPGDIVRVRPGDIIPADVKLMSGALTGGSVGAHGRIQGRG
jgi:P-type E1-E2 ATPase